MGLGRRLLSLLVGMAIGCGGHGDAGQDRLDAQLRLAGDPSNVDAHRSLARLAYTEARPGEVVRELLLVETLANLERAERTLLGQLLAKRGAQRLRLGDPSALSDFEHARKLGTQVSTQNLAEAYESCAVAALRHASQFRHERATMCLGKLAVAHVYRRHKNLASLELEELEQLWLWFESNGAKRRALQVAQEYVERAGSKPDLLARWQHLHRWWYGSTRPLLPVEAAEMAGPERPTLQRFSDALFVDTPASELVPVAIDWGVPSWESSEATIVRAYAREPGLADRLAKRFADGDVYRLTRAAFLCELFFRLGDKERARHWAQVLVNIAPDLPASHEAAGLAHAWLGDVPRADVFFTAAAAASGDAGRQWAHATFAYLRSGQPLAAVAAGRKAIGLTARGWDMHLLLDVSEAQRALHRDTQADAALRALWGRFAPQEVVAAKELVSHYLAGEPEAELRSLLGPIRGKLGFP